ncbi:MAG: hypothetical protein DMD66_08900 [Gemmatimonadetes bacterium]|nr:MAG: hypothetical protein DMD66_08900 [Gemmatimonadota bacterium]
MLLEAVSPEGSGVLVRLRYRDSLVTATYRIIVPRDTTTPGATVAVRYLLRDMAHAFFFDTGTVQLRREGGRGGAKVSGRIEGSGIENAIRTPTRIEYHDVPVARPTDTVFCVAQP